MATFGEILYNISLGANQSIRRNATDDGWEAFTPSAGGGGVWGAITGTLSSQTDLQNALNAKANALGADDNYVTDAQLVVIGNTSGTNTGDNATNSQYSGLAVSKLDATAFSGVAKITVGTSTPVAPATGDLWVDTN